MLDNNIGKSDEELSDEELRRRWKFQHPLATLQLLAALLMCVGLLAITVAEPFSRLTGALTVIAACAIMGCCRWWLNVKSKRLSRGEIIEQIRTMREIHADDDCP